MVQKRYYDQEARNVVLEGAEELCKAVSATYGPTSGNVGILRAMSLLNVTHDGVTVAQNIELEGPQKVGAEVIKETATKMDKELGDGTTTVVILAYSILAAVQDTLTMGKSPIVVRDELEKEKDEVLSHLDALVDKDVTAEKLAQVGAISASDEEIGRQVADLVFQVGVDGAVTVQEGTGTTIEAEVTDGFTFDTGVISPYMIADASTKTTTVEEPAILVVAKKIDGHSDLLPIIQRLEGKPLVVIAYGASDEVSGALVRTNIKGLTDVVIVKAPRFAEKREAVLEDIAALTGTKVVDGKKTTFDTVELGTAKQIVTGLEKTTIVNGVGDTSERKKTLKAQIPSAPNAFEKKELEHRIAALDGRVATIKVGGESDTQVRERKYRVDDAVFACQAALRSGVVAGGAITLLELASKLPETSPLSEALTKPFDKLLTNIGKRPEDFLDKLGPGKGVNLRTGEVVDMFSAGIIEPAATVKKAIESAVSVAGTALTMNVVVVDEEDKKDERS